MHNMNSTGWRADRSRLAGEERGGQRGIQLHSDSLLSRCRLVTHRDLNEHVDTIERSMARSRSTIRIVRIHRCIVPTPVPRSRDSMNNSISRGGDRRRTVLFFFLLLFFFYLIVFNRYCEYERILKWILEWILKKDLCWLRVFVNTGSFGIGLRFYLRIHTFNR